MRRTGSVPAAAMALAAVLFTARVLGFEADEPAVLHRQAAEIVQPANDSDKAVLGRPVALAFEAGRLYIADALDCAVKVFARDGRFVRSFGRKGAGPGELSFPSGVAAAGDTIAVADKFNFRIQIFDDAGRSRGGFRVPFAPDRIYALGDQRWLVTGNPTGRRAGERLLHAYDGAGGLVWEGLETGVSADPVIDTFRNMILVCPQGEAGFWVVYRIGRRTVLRFSAAGALLDRIEIDGRHAFRRLDPPSGRGAGPLEGFCWAAAFDRDRFYLSAPEPVDGRDLGPGRTISIVDGRGRLRAVVGLPCAVTRFLVADGRLFAVDGEGALRIFEVGR